MSAREDQDLLRSGEMVAGHFWVLGDTREVPGTLRWRPDRGALIELTEAPTGWPLFDHGDFVVHGDTRGGLALTLLDPRVKQVSLGDRVSQVNAYTLALGAHTDPRTRWPAAVFSTSALSEWRDDTGIKVSHPGQPDDWNKVRLDWEPPARDEVPVAGASLTFAGRMSDSGWGSRPDWTVCTWQVVEVDPRVPLTMHQYQARYALPLVAFTSFASDRPDVITREIYRDPEERTVVEVWRVGATIEPEEWNPVPGRRFLVHANDLVDYPWSS